MPSRLLLEAFPTPNPLETRVLLQSSINELRNTRDCVSR